jgi:hypothetical protein
VEVRRVARLATHTVIIAADEESLATDHLIGEPEEMDAEDWAGRVALSLEEGALHGPALLGWLEVDAEVRVADDLGVLDDADHRRRVDLTTLA